MAGPPAVRPAPEVVRRNARPRRGARVAGGTAWGGRLYRLHRRLHGLRGLRHGLPGRCGRRNMSVRGHWRLGRRRRSPQRRGALAPGLPGTAGRRQAAQRQAMPPHPGHPRASRRRPVSASRAGRLPASVRGAPAPAAAPSCPTASPRAHGPQRPGRRRRRSRPGPGCILVVGERGAACVKSFESSSSATRRPAFADSPRRTMSRVASLPRPVWNSNCVSQVSSGRMRVTSSSTCTVPG